MLLCALVLFGFNVCDRNTKKIRGRMFHQTANEFYKLDEHSLLIVGNPRSQLGAPWKHAWQRAKIGVNRDLRELVGEGKDAKEAVNQLKTEIAAILEHGHTVYVLDVSRFPDGKSMYPNRANAISAPLERFGITANDLDQILLCQIKGAQLVESRYFEHFPFLELRGYCKYPAVRQSALR